MKDKVYSGGLRGGQVDTPSEDGLRAPGLRVARNTWYDTGAPKRRKGIQRIGRFIANLTIFVFDGTDDFLDVPFDANIHALKRLWTVEVLALASSLATNEKNMIGWAHATDYPFRLYFTTAGKIVAKVQDTAGTVVTLTSASTFVIDTIYAIQLVRDGTALYLRVNGTLEASGTMADLDCKTPGGNMTIGRNNGTDHFAGRIDFARAMLTARSNQDYGKIRLPDPLCTYVVFDYICGPSASGRCDDRSTYQNNATTTGSPATNGTALAVQTQPVTAIHEWLDPDNKRRLFIAAGQQHTFAVLTR